MRCHFPRFGEFNHVRSAGEHPDPKSILDEFGRFAKRWPKTISVLAPSRGDHTREVIMVKSKRRHNGEGKNT